MKIYIKEKTAYYSIIRYVLKIIEKNKGTHFSFVNSADKADVFWDHTLQNSEAIGLEFYENLHRDDSNFSHQKCFSRSPIIETKSGLKDSIATIFYMLNCLQEYMPQEETLDQFRRFKYSSSYQARFQCIEENLVQKEIDLLCEKLRIEGSTERSSFFISHDIDTIYASFLEDGFWAVKNLKIAVILKLIALAFIRKPHWKNIDKILKLNSEYDIRSTFFWLVNKGKGSLNIKNADYKIRNEQSLLKLAEEAGAINALHKSCTSNSINEELKKGNFTSNYNRYHFLRFLTHEDWKAISESKLEFDSSLGYAEHYGFRNSYGKAFQPFNIKSENLYDFIEAPLNFMDGTFHKYMKLPKNKVADIIIDFYERNSRNCNFSLLWHNSYFTDYKYHGFLEEYKKIIRYIYEAKIECVTPLELVKRNKIEW